MADWDVVVVGSGFGGSVAALRAVEKGYRVLVVEAGKRWRDEDFPKTNWNARNYLWAPALGAYGLQRIDILKHVMVLSGAGVGGGSLVYANTLYRPLDAFYNDAQWRHIADWKAELAPYYDQATRMLGVVENPEMTPADEAFKAVAEKMGVGDTFRRTPVGVLFGAHSGATVSDPFFGGAGPARTTCTSCGGCMTGCRVGAKNTLVKNYLHLAENAGARIAAMTTVSTVRPLAGGGYALDVRRTGGSGPGATKTITADQVVLAAGALGTQRLMLRMKGEGHLPALSDRLGHLFRTNSEALLGVETFDYSTDHSRGVAITSSFHPDHETHVEPTRFGKGANAMLLLSTLLVEGNLPGEDGPPRWRRFLSELARDPSEIVLTPWVHRYSERGFVILVMQSRDNSLTVSLDRGLTGRAKLVTSEGHGESNPSWIPQGHDVARRVAEAVGGRPRGSWPEIADIPMTAHILGGAAIGDSIQTGVIDPWHRVYGYPGLHVTDGAAVSANLGVNPSLTITAQAERAMSFWPNKGQDDPRPVVGADYKRVAPIEPKSPVVPADAPGALRLPVG
ncbi:MAG: GMC family oxidoreductase [Jiangellales bacterium]